MVNVISNAPAESYVCRKYTTRLQPARPEDGGGGCCLRATQTLRVGTSLALWMVPCRGSGRHPGPRGLRPSVGEERTVDIEYFSYKGYRIPVHLVQLTGGGPESFDLISRGHMDQLARYAPVVPRHNVLEVGCGIGRDAIPLSEVLDPEATYLGVDIIRDSIEWCSQNIGRRHPNFGFVHYDVQDQLHNPTGTMATTDIRFPLPTGSVDRVIGQSVFTHMFEKNIIHYLKEFHRVLRPDGLVMVSFFVVDEPKLRHVRGHEAELAGITLRFPFDYGDGCYVNDEQFPAGAVAYDIASLRRMVDASGMELAQPVHYGFWSGMHPGTYDGQDMVVLRSQGR